MVYAIHLAICGLTFISLIFDFYSSLWILDISFWHAAGRDFLPSRGLSVLFWLLSLLCRNWIPWDPICWYLGLIPVLLVFVQKPLACPNVLKVILCFSFLEVSVFQILNKVSDTFWNFLFLYKRKDTELISFSCKHPHFAKVICWMCCLLHPQCMFFLPMSKIKWA